MKVHEVRSWHEDVPLSRPYAIAGRRIDAVRLFFVELIDDRGRVGLGSAAPSEAVTGESYDACTTALSDDALGWLVGEDARHIGRTTGIAADTMAGTPAARAAVDMALWDLFGQRLEVPLVDLFGARRREPLPTSITVGIQSIDDALDDTREYLDRGFRCLKVKIGDDWREDVERLERLRALVGPTVAIRVDANEGYGRDELTRLATLVDRLDLELVEQPLPRGAAHADPDATPTSLRPRIAADESCHDATDALDLIHRRACGIFNIKLMKCGGPTGGRQIAELAEIAGLDLMWGCMDESVISIAAALHTAYASPRTRYLDLDGSFDLARDPAVGGFQLDDGGRLRLTGGPGLGVSLRRS
ncbi:MAG: dipeptide epimerase [Acidobacteriota bacterium]